MTQSQQPSANAPAPRTAADYQAQLDEKRARLTELFAGFTLPALEVHSSPAEYYRMRAEFRIWHEGDDLFHCMYAPATKEIIKIDHFPTASRLINRLMPLLLEGLRPHPVLRRKLFQIDYLSTQSGQIIVSLLYHRKLEAEWQQAAEALQADLRAKGFELQLIGRAHKQKICLGDDFVIEQLNVAGRQLIYKQVENSFTQPNAAINEQMLAWALDVTKGSEGDLLELYCGNGNFSIALAQNFRKVLATEIAKPSVDSAQFNIAANGVDNLIILRMSAEEFTMAMRGEREFNRLKGVDLGLPVQHHLRRPAPRRSRRCHRQAGAGVRQHPLHLLQPRDSASQHGGAGGNPRDRTLRPVRPVPLDPPHGGRGLPAPQGGLIPRDKKTGPLGPVFYGAADHYRSRKWLTISLSRS